MKRCIDFRRSYTRSLHCPVHTPIRLETDPEFMGDDPFPKRVRLGRGKCRVCWWYHEVIEWLERRSARR